MLRSQDYYEHISKVRRAPSVLTDVPRYPSAHLAFSRKAVHEEDKGGLYGHHHHNHPHDDERVEVLEYEQTSNPGNGAGEVYEENADVESDQYYPRRSRGGFELQKWKTFRP